MEWTRELLLVSFFGVLILPVTLWACDLCAIYTAQRAADAPTGSWQLGVTERFTSFTGRARTFFDSGDNFRQQQSLESSITQFYLSYQALEWLGFQVTLPYIYRDFKRVRNGLVEKGDEYGFGDLALLLNTQPVRYQEGETMFFLSLYTGVKLPTGDADRLEEEEESTEERQAFLRHSSGSGTLVGGDDLTIGTGSTDVLFGSAFFAEEGRFFLSGDVQYVLRTEGASDFEFGDEIVWSIGPGVQLILDHPFTLALRARLSGESKQTDILDGDEVRGSAHDRVFLGPELSATFGTQWRAELGVDIPIERESTNDGVEPEYRLLGRVSYWFSS